MEIPSKTSQGNRGDEQGILNQHAKLSSGVDSETLQQLFLKHAHSGQVLDAQPVRALILADAVNKHVYNITIVNGVLTPVRIS